MALIVNILDKNRSLNKTTSVGGSDFLLSMSFSKGDTCSNFSDSGHSVFTFFKFGDSNVGGADGYLNWGAIGFVFS